jgi:ABC-type oligopeptide transport system substrate-binding subunit
MIRKILSTLLLILLIGLNGLACSNSASSPTSSDDEVEVYNSTNPFVVNKSLGAGVNLGHSVGSEI